MYGTWSASYGAHSRSIQEPQVPASAGASAMTRASSAMALFTAAPMAPEELSTFASAGETRSRNATAPSAASTPIPARHRLDLAHDLLDALDRRLGPPAERVTAEPRPDSQVCRGLGLHLTLCHMMGSDHPSNATCGILRRWYSRTAST